VNQIKNNISKEDKIDHSWLVELVKKKSSIHCVDSFQKLKNSKDIPLSYKESLKLLNYALLFHMVDSRQVIEESVLKKIQGDKSILQLLMKNWLDIRGLRGIISNILMEEKEKAFEEYANYRMTNKMFLKVINDRYSEEMLKNLGVLNKMSSAIIMGLHEIAPMYKNSGSDLRV
jgi:hypothetical protein